MHLYIHVPFCARRCSYCDFAIAVRRVVPSAEFTRAIESEWISRQGDPAWDASPSLDTVYFGGGTPSRLDPAALARLLARFRADRPVARDAEITIEANPEDVTPAAAEAWRAAGVNRVSLGAQAFHASTLEWMHRTHDAPRIGRAVQTLRGAGFANLSLDLIYGLPDALGRDWPADLEAALSLAPEHLSLYALTVERHTPLGHWTARGEAIPAPDERAADEFLLAHDALTRDGFEHYEVSNAARPGLRARHNAAYWRRAPFLGLGPSAHSGAGVQRSWNVREWEEYRRLSEAGRPVQAGAEALDPEAVRLEELYLGLRTDAGVPSGMIPAAAREAWVAEGWASSEDGRVRLTAQGWLRLDALVGSVT